ncbi:hypothetical protein EON82_23605 [bacterium]|nr:MAG: hypothetical protein EON82_23605 [bacterium]
MRIDLPLVLALAAKANSFFRGASGRMEVLAGHPAFARFHDIAFVRQTGLGGDLIADASVPWYRRLKNEGVSKVRPFLGGMKLDRSADSPWGILAEGDKGLELWAPSIGRRFQGHDDPMPFRLTMTSGRFDRWSLKDALPVEEAATNLASALGDARTYLEDAGQSTAAAVVGKFILLHEASSPETPGELASITPDLAPCALPLFASSARVLNLLETTGWLTANDDAARRLAAPLWEATRIGLETAI